MQNDVRHKGSGTQYGSVGTTRCGGWLAPGEPPTYCDGDHADVREQVRSTCAGFSPAYFREVDRHQGQPEEFFAALRQAGWANALVSRAKGGMGLSLAHACAAVEEIGLLGASAAGLVQEICNHLLLARHSDHVLADAYVSAVLSGELRAPSIAIWNLGSAAGVAVRSRCIDGEIVSGRKAWVSRAQNGDVLLLLVEVGTKAQRTEPHSESSLFLVDLREAIGRGLTIHPSTSRDNHDASEIAIDALLIPARNLIGRAGEGARYIAERCMPEMILSAAAAVGDARWLLNQVDVHTSAISSMQFNDWSRPGTTYEALRASSGVEAASLMCKRAANCYDSMKACEGEARMALTLALAATREATELCLGMGHCSDSGLNEDIDRKLRECRRHQVMPFATDQAHAYIAERVLGLPRSQ